MISIAGKTNALSHLVMREFEKWTKKQRGDFEHLLNKDIKQRAFKLGTTYHMTNLDFIVKAFRLNHGDNDHFISDIRLMLEKKKYKEVLYPNDQNCLFSIPLNKEKMEFAYKSITSKTQTMPFFRDKNKYFCFT